MLIAIDKIYIPERKYSESALKLEFGEMTSDGVFQIGDENEVNRIYHHFALFNKNKQLMNEQIRLEEILNQQESKKRSEATFKPSICTKSEKLARKNRSQVMQR